MNSVSGREYKKEILLCVVGLNPQVVTETIYAMAQMPKEGPCPDEVHLVTTGTGAHKARQELLRPEGGQLALLCREHGLPIPRCNDSTIHVIQRAGRSVEDLRSVDDNKAAADTILDVVRELTVDPESRVHFSIAGGRKTMSYYLGYCASLLGRSQDKMSHVLVSDSFESMPEFFFPPREPKPADLNDENDRPQDTSKAKIDLADVPFIRLRRRLPQALLAAGRSFSDTVKSVNAMQEPKLRLALLPPESKDGHWTWSVEVVDGPKLDLSAAHFALLWMFCRARQHADGLLTTETWKQRYLEWMMPVYRLTDDEGRRFEKKEQSVSNLTEKQFRNQIDKFNKALRTALPWSDESFGVEVSNNRKAGKHRRDEYALRIPKESVTLNAPASLLE